MKKSNPEAVMTFAKIVREYLKAYGANHVWNNIYSTGTRTVKCYPVNVLQNRTVDQICMDIANLRNLGPAFENLTVSISLRGNRSMPHAPSSLIVKIK